MSGMSATVWERNGVWNVLSHSQPIRLRDELSAYWFTRFVESGKVLHFNWQAVTTDYNLIEDAI